MSGADAISLGYNPSFGADQYWQQYAQWSQGLDKQYAANTATQNGQSGQTTQGTTTNTVFKGSAPAQATQQKESHTGRNLLIFGASAAAIIAGVALKKGCGDKTIKEVFQNKEVLPTMKTGFGNMWQGIKGGASSLNKKFTANVTENGAYYTGLGKTQTLDKAEQLTEDALKAIGLDKNFTATELELGNFVSGRFKVGENIITVKDGKIASYLDKDGKTITEGIDAIKDSLMNFLKKPTGSGVTIESAEFKDIATEGVEKIFTRNGATATWDLTKVTTDRFAADSDAIKAIINGNPTGTLAKQINAGKDQQKLIDAGLKPNIIERTITGTDGHNYRVQFTGNTVTGIYEDSILRGVNHDYFGARIGTTQKAELASWSELIKGNDFTDFNVINWC